MFGLGFIKGTVLTLTAGIIAGLVIKKVCKSKKDKSQNLNNNSEDTIQDIANTEAEINN
jgi:uncharacterized membrane-anchored protein YhcB (DUF1043 family)